MLPEISRNSCFSVLLLDAAQRFISSVHDVCHVIFTFMLPPHYGFLIRRAKIARHSYIALSSCVLDLKFLLTFFPSLWASIPSFPSNILFIVSYRCSQILHLQPFSVEKEGPSLRSQHRLFCLIPWSRKPSWILIIQVSQSSNSFTQVSTCRFVGRCLLTQTKART